MENSYKSFYPASLNDFSPVMVPDNKEVKEKVNRLSFVGAQGELSAFVPDANHSAEVLGNTIIYEDVFPGADVKYTQQNDQRKLDVVIKSQSFLNNVPAGANSIQITETLELPNVWYLERSDYGVSIYSKSQGKEIAFIPQPVATETFLEDKNYESDEDLMINGEIAFEDKGNAKFELNITFPLECLKGSSRNFPVSLDPTINVSPWTNTTFRSGKMFTATSLKSDGFIRVADKGSLGWAKFDLTSVPPAVIFLNAVYYGYHYTGNINIGSKFANIVGIKGVDPVTMQNTAISAQVSSGPIYNGNYIFGGNGAGCYNGQLDQNVLSDLADEADIQGWTALAFKDTSGNAAFMYHHGHNAPSNICYLEIEYVFSDDAGIESVESPGVPNCLDEDLYVKLSTISPDTITSVRIEWSVNGVNQTPLNWTGNLPPSSTMKQPVLVGNYHFQQGDHLKVWTADPNGVAANFPDNDTVEFTVPSFPVANIDTGKLLCYGETITLETDIGFADHQWSTGSRLPQVTINKAGIYSVTVTDNNSGCEHAYEVNVMKSPRVQLPDTLVWGCRNLGGVTLSGNVEGGSYLRYQGFVTPQVTITESGSYWVQMVDSTGKCTTYDTADVEIYDIPQPNFTKTMDSLTVAFTNNTSDADSYLWHFGDGHTSTDFEPTHVYREPGNYDVKLRAINRCGQNDSTIGITVGPVSVGDIEISSQVSFYPNPNNGWFNVDFAAGHLENVRLEILDMQVRLIQSEQVGTVNGKLTHQVNLNSVGSGIYLVKVVSKDEVIAIERVSVK